MESGLILKVEPTGLADGLDMGVGEKGAPRFLVC